MQNMYVTDFFKSGHFIRVCTEKMIDHQYRGKSLLSMLSISIEKLCLIDNFVEQSAKLEDSRKILAGLVFEFQGKHCQPTLKSLKR